MDKKENDEKLIGYCKYCGQGNQISETDEYLTETADLDEIATMRCRCTEGTDYRRRARTKEDAEQKIRMNLNSEEHQRVLLGLVDPVVEEMINSVTVNFGGGFVAAMSLNKNKTVRITLRKSNSMIIE